MKHASESTLESVASMLERRRSMDALVEKSPGVFYRKSRAFLHFHEDPSGMFVDVRFKTEEEFTRLPVTTPKKQAALRLKVERALSH